MATKFTGFVDGTWGKPEGKTNRSVVVREEYNNSSLFKWGKPANGSFANSLVFTKNQAFDAKIDTPFAIGKLTYSNGTISAGTGVNSVPLEISFDLDNPTDETKEFKYDLGLFSTINTGDPEADADFVYFPNTFDSESFTFNNKEYTLEILGFSKNNGKKIESQFHVREEEGDTASLFAQITEVPEEEPDPDPDIKDYEKKVEDKIGFVEDGIRDNVDIYRFEVDAYSEVNITLDQLERNANINILAENGIDIIAQSSETGDKEESITEFLNPGTYYAQILPDTTKDKTPYCLEITTDKIKDEKDSFATAQDLGVLGPETSIKDKIGQGKGKRKDNNDYYKFELKDTHNVVVNLDELKRNADVILYDSNGDQLNQGKNSGDKFESFTQENLLAGDYYVRVFPKSNQDITDYRLGLSALEITVEDDDEAPGKDLGTLLPIGKDGTLGGKSNIGNVKDGRRDGEDYYKFSLETDSYVNLTVNGLRTNPKNLDLEVYEWENGELGDEITDPEVKEKSIIWQPLTELEAGEYVVKLKANGKTKTPYNLRLFAEPPYEDDYPTRPEALDLGFIGEEKVRINELGFQNSFNGKDQRDWFRFEVEKDTQLNFTLDGLTGDADMRLYEGNQQGPAYSEIERGTKKETFEYEAEAEKEYFVEVLSGKGKGKGRYILEIETVDQVINPQTFEVGDLYDLPEDTYNNKRESSEAATEVGEVGGGVKNRQDRFEFSIDQDSIIQVDLKNLRENLNLRLQEDNGTLEGGTLIDFQDERSTTSEQILESLPSGDYVVTVETEGSASSPYELTIKAIDDEDIDPDGGLPTSSAPLPFVQDIGVLNEREDPYEQPDEIGAAQDFGRDQNDYYKFELTEDQDFSLGFSAQKKARVQLLSENLSPLQSFNNQKKVSFTESDFSAGTYYVRVQAGTGSTPYTLNLEAGEVGFDPDGGDNQSPVGSNKVNPVVFTNGVFTAEDDIGLSQAYGPDVNDFYKFTVDAKSNFSLQLDVDAKADVKLLDSNGIIERNGQGSLDKSITSTLTPGDYYVQVARRGANQTEYDLTMSLNPIGVGDGNDTFETADPLTGLIVSDVGRTIGGQRDEVDYYEFTATNSGLTIIEFEVYKGNIDLNLYDADKFLVSSASFSQNILAPLEVGKQYFVEISGAGSGSSSYGLNLSS